MTGFAHFTHQHFGVQFIFGFFWLFLNWKLAGTRRRLNSINYSSSPSHSGMIVTQGIVWFGGELLEIVD